MMTEIQWLVDIMLHHKLPVRVRELFIARIGEVEAQLGRAVPQQQPKAISLGPVIQAPSTQRLLEGHEPIAPMHIPPPPPAKIDKETGRPIVSTGNGTAGPRKF